MTEWTPQKRPFKIPEFVEEFRSQRGIRGMGPVRAALQTLLLGALTIGAVAMVVTTAREGRIWEPVFGILATVLLGVTTWALALAFVAIVRERLTPRGPMQFEELEDVVERVPERRDAWPQNQPGTSGWTPPPDDDGELPTAADGPEDIAAREREARARATADRVLTEEARRLERTDDAGAEEGLTPDGPPEGRRAPDHRTQDGPGIPS